jgi:hypothetical protein
MRARRIRKHTESDNKRLKTRALYDVHNTYSLYVNGGQQKMNFVCDMRPVRASGYARQNGHRKKKDSACDDPTIVMKQVLSSY